MRNSRFWRCAAAALMLAVCLSAATAEASRGPAKRAAVRQAASTAPAIVKSDRHLVKKGETLATILSARGIGRREIWQWDAAIRKAVGPVVLAPNHVLTLHFAKGNRLTGVSYEINDDNQVIVERHGKGLRGHSEPLRVNVTVVGAQGVVEKTFHRAALRAGIPDRVISQMADILGWEFDFRRVRQGDRFRVVYERRVTQDGRVLTPGKVLAAEIRTARRAVQAFYFDDGVEGTYVDGNGRVLAQSFLRYPVEFSRISSHFAKNRFHPILKRGRPHNGVDFAAPVGTPVRAAGDGVVTFAGRNGDYGVHIALRHGDGLTTTYSHLRGITRSVRAGVAVRQGEVIGWVGQTGLTTGPHLHFALYRNNHYLNPLTATVSLRRGVRDVRRFEVAKRELLQHLAAVPRPVTAPPAEAVALAALPPARRLSVLSITQ